LSSDFATRVLCGSPSPGTASGRATVYTRPAPDSLRLGAAASTLASGRAAPNAADWATQPDESSAAEPTAIGAGAPGADLAIAACTRGGAGRPMYQGLSSGSVCRSPCRVVDKTSVTSGQSSPVCWVISAR